MGGGRRREGEGKEGLPLIHSCSKKLSAHKLYNIQKIKYRKLMYIKLSTEKCKGLVYIKSMTLYLMYKTGTLVILCTRVKKDFSLPPPPPILTLFCCMGKGVLLQLYGWRGKRTGQCKGLVHIKIIDSILDVLNRYIDNFMYRSIRKIFLSPTPLHPYSCNKTPLPIQQKSVKMGGGGEKNLSLFLYAGSKIPTYD
jgi:hypothetical protein